MSEKRTIGILGVSANPMHDGHVAAGLLALHELHLNEVWFMVTPHSPHKDSGSYAPLEHRMHLAHLALMPTGRLGNKLKVSDFEAALLRYGEENSTANMLERFTEVYPSYQPVWLMGADNLKSFHTWGRWQEIIERYPLGVLGRYGEGDALQSIAAKEYEAARVASTDFKAEPGTWSFIEDKAHSASSTQIRAEIARGISPSHLTADADMYIKQYGLYGAKTQ